MKQLFIAAAAAMALPAIAAVSATNSLAQSGLGGQAQRAAADVNMDAMLWTKLRATPMAGLLGDRGAVERESIVQDVAADTESLLDPEMLRGGRLSFPQEAHVAIAHKPC